MYTYTEMRAFHDGIETELETIVRRLRGGAIADELAGIVE